MTNVLKAALVAATVLSASMAQAGGPLIIEEGNNEVVTEKPASSVGILPVLGALVISPTSVLTVSGIVERSTCAGTGSRVAFLVRISMKFSPW